MQDWSIGTYLDRLAAPHPTPASAAVAALNLAQAAALLAMVAGLRADPDSVRRAQELREAALEIAEADARAVEAIVAALALPRSTGTERERRTVTIADALLAAAGPPAQAIPLGGALVGLCERMAEVATGAVLGDVAAAADATAAALSISRTNVEADVAPRRDMAEAQRLLAAIDPVDDLLRRAARVRDDVRRRFTTG